MAVRSGVPGIAQVDGLEIAYESTGEGEPALVFITGGFEDRSYFAPQVARFAGERRVVTVEVRGHGRSSVPSEATIDSFVRDVLAVAEAAEIRSAVLCGHSMSGVVVQKVANARPDLARAVVMIDGTPLLIEPVRQMALSELVPALATEHWNEALLGYFNNVILDPDDPQELKERVNAAVGSTEAGFARTFFTSVFASDFADDVGQARCPLLYIHAKVPVDLDRLRELRPDATIEYVAGSGHYAMLTATDQVNAMLARFIDRHAPVQVAAV